MPTEQATKTPRRIIFAGANIAFGMSFLGYELLGILNGVSPADLQLQANLGLLIVGINVLSGYAGGYLTAKNAGGDALQLGTLTGVLAYIIQQIVHAALYGWGVMGNAFTTLALIGGAIAGAVLYESQMRRVARIRATGSQVEEQNGESEDLEAGSEDSGEEPCTRGGKPNPRADLSSVGIFLASILVGYIYSVIFP